MDRFFTLFRYFAPPNYHEKAGVSSSFSERRHKFTSAKEIVGKSHIFQSKHSVRCTLGVSSILSQPHFNPHSHVGSDYRAASVDLTAYDEDGNACEVDKESYNIIDKYLNAA